MHLIIQFSLRRRSPYTWSKGQSDVSVVRRNSARLAEVWMDEYKELYYQRTGRVPASVIGDISERVSLRASLNCSSFRLLFVVSWL